MWRWAVSLWLGNKLMVNSLFLTGASNLFPVHGLRLNTWVAVFKVKQELVCVENWEWEASHKTEYCCGHKSWLFRAKKYILRHLCLLAVHSNLFRSSWNSRFVLRRYLSDSGEKHSEFEGVQFCRSLCDCFLNSSINIHRNQVKFGGWVMVILSVRSVIETFELEQNWESLIWAIFILSITHSIFGVFLGKRVYYTMTWLSTTMLTWIWFLFWFQKVKSGAKLSDSYFTQLSSHTYQSKYSCTLEL